MFFVIQVNEGLLWKKVLEVKYGSVKGLNLIIGCENKYFLSWKDIVDLGVLRGVTGDWLQEIFTKNFGSGGSIKFWLDRWVGSSPLYEVFPILFQVSLQLGLTIKEMRD
jgi:hypothetical protein